MTRELASIDHPSTEIEIASQVDVIDAFLSGRKQTTRDAYDKDLRDFARTMGQPDARTAIGYLLSLTDHGQANAVVLSYKAKMIKRGLASATVARRLAALRSVVKLARTLGRVSWCSTSKAPRSNHTGTRAGPGMTGGP